MTFIECCELIADVKDNYKVIYPSFVSRQQFSFRFERGGKQFDAFDVVYEHYRTLGLLPAHTYDNLSSRIKALGMHIMTAALLINLSNGAWKKDIPLLSREQHERAREDFERITGIRIG